MENKFKNWWMVLIKGIILVILSFFIFRHPVSTLIGLTMYIGIALLFTGVLLVVTSLSNRKSHEGWGFKLTEGILDIIFGMMLLSNPAISAVVFPFVIGFWMIFYGIMTFVGAFTAKKEGNSDWWMSLIGGILTVLLGYAISSNIVVGAIAVTFWIGLGLLIFGIVNISISIRLKKLNN